jgi:hypothetical protein
MPKKRQNREVKLPVLRPDAASNPNSRRTSGNTD